MLTALALSGLACNFAYGVIEDATGILLGSEDSAESPGLDLGEELAPEFEAPSRPDGEPESITPGTFSDQTVSPEIREEMEQIETEVILLRGLQPSGPVDRNLLSEDGLRDYVVNDFFGDYTREEGEDDARLYALLGLVEPGFNIYDLFLDLYSEGIAGFYDPDAREMFVVQDSRFGGPERLTYAHEYAHVLQDQVFDLREGLEWSDDACEDESERCAAIRALIEGDATLLEERWLLTYASDADFQQLLDFYDSYSSPTYESAPEF